jgi:predicted DNA-binding ribbon-helix-helix protein
MKSTVLKRSLVVRGAPTSVSFEEPFWNGFREIAQINRLTIAELATRIDEERKFSNLSSAIRVFVLVHYSSGAAINSASVSEAANQSKRP